MIYMLIKQYTKAKNSGLGAGEGEIGKLIQTGCFIWNKKVN